jgi:hypothetical protein
METERRQVLGGGRQTYRVLLNFRGDKNLRQYRALFEDENVLSVAPAVGNPFGHAAEEKR